MTKEESKKPIDTLLNKKDASGDPKNITKAPTKEEAIGKIKDEMAKKGKKAQGDYVSQIATRDKIERDFKEDILRVSFDTSPETTRTIKAHRPNQRQMLKIMKLSAEAMLYENRTDAKSLNKMLEIYDELPIIASELCVDKSLDKEFWVEKISFAALQNFISAVITTTQTGGMEPGELESFREE